MSGGILNTPFYQIQEVIERIEKYIKSNPDSFCAHSNEVNDKLKEGVVIIKQANIYLRRIDWLVSGDDSEESFITRLNEDLQKLKQEFDDKLSKEGFTK